MKRLHVTFFYGIGFAVCFSLLAFNNWTPAFPNNQLPLAAYMTKATAPEQSQTRLTRDAVLLNGKPLDYPNFSLASQGQLTVVLEDTETDNSVAIPFQIYLRRNGTTIQHGASDTVRSVLAVDVTTVLALAKAGDLLIIEPSREDDAGAGRQIKLKEFIFMPNLFSFFRNRKDGC